MVRRQILLAALAATSTALSTMRREAAHEELFTIELAPGVTRVVTEEQKWDLRKVSGARHGVVVPVSVESRGAP